MSKTRWLAFDDSDPAIDYRGPWDVVQDSFTGADYGSYGPTYGGSQHATNGTASLAFPFTGSSVRVYGTINVLNVSNVLDPQWECFVDGVSIGIERPWSSWQNNYPLCSTYNQTFGRHTLTLNVSAADERTFYVDQIRYLPLANLTSELDHPIVIIDQLDTSISYTPSADWGPMAQTSEVTLTVAQGASMSVNFTGAKVTWMGWIPEGYPAGQSIAQYQLDDAEPVTFALRGLQNGAPNQFNQQLFETPTVEKGNHRLTVTHMGTSAPLVLDFLLIEDGDIIFGNAGTISATTSSGSTATNTNIPGSNTGVATTSSSTKGFPVGAVVGGVLGGVVLIALLIFAFLFYKRKRANARLMPHSRAQPMAPAMYQSVPSYGPSFPPVGTPIIDGASYVAPISAGQGSVTSKTSHTHQYSLSNPTSHLYHDGSDSIHQLPQKLEPVRKNSPSPAPSRSHTPVMFVTRGTPGGASTDPNANTTLEGMRAARGDYYAQGAASFQSGMRGLDPPRMGTHIPNSPNIIYE